ncbi:hypothetical protein [Erythrobacter crassostreae]|uniref:Uncharacterized protein n=1 Tax=Erythrobacter crassostreae TaxID=2828328 RepID=A0A9X1JM89_9SPHN|nr:hypothetical protein [Erythrobacter crassostrea]MBV7259149.1 hypothetical protein [Erythrobacter crassostrea]
MKSLVIALAGTALVSVTVTSGAIGAERVEAAGPFDKLKKKIKKAKKTAEDVDAVATEVDRANRTNGRSLLGSAAGSSRQSGCHANRGSTSNSPCTAKAPGHVGGAAPAPAKFKGQTNCASLGLGNAFIAEGGNYTFSQGISTQERSGLINRRNVSATDGCFFGGLGVGDVLYVEFDRNKYKKHDYKIQCVSYDGSEQLDNVNGPSVGNYKGKDVMLHTGHSLGYTPTASGSNSSRSGAYDKHLAKRGRTMLTFNFGALHTDKSGTDFYCQWFNKNSGQSAIAFAYRRGPQG